MGVNVQSTSLSHPQGWPLPIGLRCYPLVEEVAKNSTRLRKRLKDALPTFNRKVMLDISNGVRRLRGLPDIVKEGKGLWPKESLHRPPYMLVVDTETATENTADMPGFAGNAWRGEYQSLLFGSARLYVHKSTGALHEKDEWQQVGEWLFYPDELPEHGRGIIQDYAATVSEPMGTGRALKGTRIAFECVPLSKFLGSGDRDKMDFYKIAVRDQALVVGFNLPFDLSRLALDVGATRAHNGNSFMAGGFSFTLWPPHKQANGKEVEYKPRLQIKRLDSKMGSIRFTAENTGRNSRADTRSGRSKRGRFLDLSQMLWALTESTRSLEGWCQAFGIAGKLKTLDGLSQVHGLLTPEYIEYNREDVRATFDLAVKVLEEFDHHPISTEAGGSTGVLHGALAETGVYSAATIGKHYLQEMGVRARAKLQPDFSPLVQGYAMEAYYGGRVETRIVKTEVPIVYGDFTSMYPTVNSLMGLWNWVIAGRIETYDATEEARELLEGVTVETAMHPEFWKQITFIAEIVPDGDILPVRAKYSGKSNSTYSIGINPYHSSKPQWYAGPDLIASKFMTATTSTGRIGSPSGDLTAGRLPLKGAMSGGKVPQVKRAIGFRAMGVQDGLTPIKLRGTVEVDSRTQDFFNFVIRERSRVKSATGPYSTMDKAERDTLQKFLKLLANSCSYGIYAQMNLEEAEKQQEVTIYAGHGPEHVKSTRYEKPGEYFFAPMATLITSASRLMLALLQTRVEAAGGSYAMCDTDSMAIVSTKEGGTLRVQASGADGKDIPQGIKALSWQEVDGILAEFNGLSPYGHAVKFLIKKEDENFDEGGKQVQLYAFTIAAKRYCLYQKRDGHNTIVKASESGLGQYMEPWQGHRRKDRIVETWQTFIDGKNDVPWGEVAPVQQSRVSSWALYERFKPINESKPYSERIKPFNFMLNVSASSDDSRHLVLIAPFERNPDKWGSVQWMDYKNPARRYRLTESGSTGATALARSNWAGMVREYHQLGAERGMSESEIADELRKLRDTFIADGLEIAEDDFEIASYRNHHSVLFHVIPAGYFYHSEDDWLGPDGLLLTWRTRGVLQRRSVARLKAAHLSKDLQDIQASNPAEPVEHAIGHPRLTQMEYHGTAGEVDLNGLSIAEIVEALGVSENIAKNIHSGDQQPTEGQLLAVVAYRQAKSPEAALIIRLAALVPARTLAGCTGIPREEWVRAASTGLLPFPPEQLPHVIEAMASWALPKLPHVEGLNLAVLRTAERPSLDGKPRTQDGGQDTQGASNVLLAYCRQTEGEQARKQVAETATRDRKDRKASMFYALHVVAPEGIRPHQDRTLAEEFRNVPRSLRARKGHGQPADEVASHLAELFPELGIESEDDLYQALAEVK